MVAHLSHVVTEEKPLAPTTRWLLCQHPLTGFDPRASLLFDHLLQAEEALKAAYNLLVPAEVEVAS